jgi:hypothetical protein
MPAAAAALASAATRTMLENGLFSSNGMVSPSLNISSNIQYIY